MSRGCARTIGLRIRINRHGGASARCSVSNRRDQPSASCPFMPPFTTRSTSSAISHPAARSASCETKRSGRGEPPPRPEAQRAFQTSRRRNQVGVTAPIQPVGIRFSADGKLAFVATGPANRVAVIDAATKQVLKYLLVGQRVWQLADGKYLLSTSGVSNDVSV